MVLGASTMKYQLRIKPPPEDDPNHHCSVSEAGGDSPRTPEGVASSKSGFGANLRGKMTKLRSGISAKMKGSKQSSASSEVSDPAASSSMQLQRIDERRSSNLTEKNLQGHEGQLVDGEASMVTASMASETKRTMLTNAHTHYSSHYSSAPTAMTSTSKGSSDPGAYQGADPGDEPVYSPRLWPPPLPDQLIYLTRRKLAAVSSAIVFWSLIVSGALFVYIWRYFVVQVDDVQGFAAAAAMKQVQVRTEDLLAPAFSVARILSLATKMGSSPLDYNLLNQLLVPQFQSSPVLTEVHISDALSGSVLVQPGTIHADFVDESQRSLLFRSDRANCNSVARSCALHPMGANVSDWYVSGIDLKTNEEEYSEGGREERAFRQFVTWHGPSFLKFSSYATAWDVYHWNPAYSLVSKLSYTSSAILRVVLNVNGLREVVQEAEESTKGKVYICTGSGQVLAASDMSQAVQVDMDTGSVNFRHVWELEQVWASMVTETTLLNGEAQDFMYGWVIGQRVFVRPFETGGSKMLDLKLRIILAVPRSALALQWLEILSPVCALLGALPLLTLLSYCFVKGVLRYQKYVSEKAERRRRETEREKEKMAKLKAERMGKVASATSAKASAKKTSKKGGKKGKK